jgi:uncharacterized membrane protein YjjB (DUF3815 family)
MHLLASDRTGPFLEVWRKEPARVVGVAGIEPWVPGKAECGMDGLIGFGTAFRDLSKAVCDPD